MVPALLRCVARIPSSPTDTLGNDISQAAGAHPLPFAAQAPTFPPTPQRRAVQPNSLATEQRIYSPTSSRCPLVSCFLTAQFLQTVSDQNAPMMQAVAEGGSLLSDMMRLVEQPHVNMVVRLRLAGAICSLVPTHEMAPVLTHLLPLILSTLDVSLVEQYESVHGAVQASMQASVAASAAQAACDQHAADRPAERTGGQAVDTGAVEAEAAVEEARVAATAARDAATEQRQAWRIHADAACLGLEVLANVCAGDDECTW